MTDLPERWEAIRAAEDRDDWDLCIRLCRQAISETADGVEAERIKLKLAYALLEEPRREKENVETAIAIYNELLSELPPKSLEWGELHKNLGFAYQNRLYGDRTDNLTAAAEHYENALSTMGSDADPVLRASISAEVGHVLLECGLSGDPDKHRERAGKHLREALMVFRQETHPEEFDEISRALECVLRN